MKQEIEAFLEYIRKEKGASENTVAAYQNDINQLLSFIQNDADKKGIYPQWSGVEQQTLQNYVVDLRQRGYAGATVARKLSAAKSLFKFLAVEGKINNIPIADIDSPRILRPLPQAISEDQIQILLNQAGKGVTPESKRDKAMLEILYGSGMRVSEVVSLNLSDVDTNNGCIHCPGKGYKERNVAIPMQAVEALKIYLEHGRPHLVRSDDEHALFLNRLGKRLTRQGFWHILKTYGQAINLKEKITPRVLRHSLATHLVSHGTDLHAIQTKLGHAHISTTQVYAKPDPPRQKNATSAALANNR